MGSKTHATFCVLYLAAEAAAAEGQAFSAS